MFDLNKPDDEYIHKQVASALAEDIAEGDISAELLPEKTVKAKIISREGAIFCGQAWASESFTRLDSQIQLQWQVKDGEAVQPDQTLCELTGNNRALLSGERTALNFLQLLSGVATATAQLVELVKDTGVKLLDTRKTIPGLRLAQKYAVKAGGGFNHRLGLYDQFLIKENHIAQCRSISDAIKLARGSMPDRFLVIEVETLEQLKEALDNAPDRILLDNFPISMMIKAVALASGTVPLETSGGVNPKNLRSIALTGVDYISIGGLTKHVRAVDLSMRVGSSA